MSRSKNFLKGVSSGYLAMAANVVYTMGSIPLALHYLSKQEFGLWALVSQIATYFSLIDVGMYGSTSRTIIDFKDNKTDSRYGSVILTSTLVFLIQGIIVAIAGAGLCFFVSGLMDIPPRYVDSFRVLLVCQCLFLGFGFVTRIFGILLYSHQRYDVLNVLQTFQLAVMFGILWFCFKGGVGLYSMLITGAASTVLGSVIQGAACLRLGLFPKPGFWGKPNTATFWNLFSFGGDVFLVGLGYQLMSASQILIITRVIGLDAAATWAVCTKCFTLAQQMLSKIYDYSQGAFSEMFVRGERDRLRSRFKDVLILTMASSAFFCGSIAVANGEFVRVWTHGRVGWMLINDILMATFIFIDVVARCHGCLAVFTTKQVGFARYAYFIEGAFFIVIACLGAHLVGLPGVFAALILAKIAFSCTYGLYRSKEFFGCTYQELILRWTAAPFRFLAAFLAVCFAARLTAGYVPASYRLVLLIALLSLAGLPLLWFVGLTDGLRKEIRGLAAKILGSVGSKERSQEFPQSAEQAAHARKCESTVSP